ncbi:MAG: hypothetical protein EOP50_05870, partial [Sphingobacteriales bacterium]
MKKASAIITATIPYLFILLFVYAAASKLIEFENFQAQLGQSPLLSAYTGFVSYAVIAVELGISVLLSFERTKLSGLYCSFGLMVLFCAYIVIIIRATQGTISVGDLTFLAGSFRQLRSLSETMLSRFTSIAQGAIYLNDFIDFFAISSRMK